MTWIPVNQITGNRHMVCSYSGAGSKTPSGSFGRLDGSTNHTWQHASTIPSFGGHHNDQYTVDFKARSPTDIPANTTTASTSQEVPTTTRSRSTKVVTLGTTVVAKSTKKQLGPTSAQAGLSTPLPDSTTVANTHKVTTTGAKSTANARIATSEPDTYVCEYSTINTDAIQFKFPAILAFPLHLDVSIKGQKSAKIFLTQDRSEEQTLAYYEITLGTLFEQARGTVQHCELPESCSQIEKAGGFGLSSTDFTRIWVEYEASGRIQVGHFGQPAEIDVTDTDPISNIKYVGFSNRLVATEWIFHDYC
ncbi:uncharacterized protein LOC121406543 [Lytechinus variegatus]|uniref:uncharacterized protein LOC121406543 n=1 Tax=Lytechinus variegatus TaxID=7654 RepID=UPI001BB154BB|nr:uncharacterized protein LOC121406543 [Lytechinus variegatus]